MVQLSYYADLFLSTVLILLTHLRGFPADQRYPLITFTSLLGFLLLL